MELEMNWEKKPSNGNICEFERNSCNQFFSQIPTFKLYSLCKSPSPPLPFPIKKTLSSNLKLGEWGGAGGKICFLYGNNLREWHEFEYILAPQSPIH